MSLQHSLPSVSFHTFSAVTRNFGYRVEDLQFSGSLAVQLDLYRVVATVQVRGEF
jgi:hypothetical protein